MLPAFVSTTKVEIVPIVHISDLTDPRLADFSRLTDIQLRKSREVAHGIYLAESKLVVERALHAGHEPRSILALGKALPEALAMLEATGQRDEQRAARGLAPIPVFTGPSTLIAELTGYALHRGLIASMERPPLPTLEDTVERARRIVIIEGVVDPTNVGLIFRSVGAIGADAVLVTPRTADPYYRRAIRVSMGTILQVPWTRVDGWKALGPQLHALGFHVAALALDDRAVTLDEFATQHHDRLALVFGSEGYGLSQAALNAADSIIEIPMRHGIDSLNVAAASAVAMWALRAS